MTYIYSPPPHPLPWHHLVPTSSPTRASALDTRVFPFSSVSLYFSVRSWYRLFIRSRSVLGTESSRAFCRAAILNVAISCKKKIIIVNIYKITLIIIFIKGLRKFGCQEKTNKSFSRFTYLEMINEITKYFNELQIIT